MYSYFTTATGFEPVRQFASGFQVHLLNHSDKPAYLAQSHLLYLSAKLAWVRRDSLSQF